jgi:sirohydrochlorin cobaltochelatase
MVIERLPMPHHPPHRALMLFSHGSPDPEWTLPFTTLQDMIADSYPELPVALAYLEPARPTFDDVVAQLVQSGAKEIVVAPVFLSRGGHVKRDLPQMVAVASATHGVAIRVLPTIGEVEVLLEAMAEWIAQSALKE